jgi:hypothetical protein
MDKNKLALIVQEAINMVFDRDAILMTQENSEWAIAHRLAVYLEQMLPGWNIDCEYNRQGQDTDIKTKTNGKKVRPDIIVHHRGLLTPEHNLLVAEIKKTNSSNADHVKLKEYTFTPNNKRRFQYQYGLAIVFNGDKVSLTWFENGQQLA